MKARSLAKKPADDRSTTSGSNSSRPLTSISILKWTATFGFGIVHSLLVRLFYTHVPDPYMDELFHVNQTREYCNGNFGYWNRMITTPPLIYVLAAWTGFCGRERFLNSAIIPLTFVGLIRLRLSRSARADVRDAILSSAAVLLLPVLFETSVLFYTDLLSLTLVVYGLGTTNPSVAAVIFGFSVFSRQTNIVWAAFYCFSNLQREFDSKRPIRSTFECVLRHWAFGLLGAGFLVFVRLNNGVVLGDRSAHRVHFHVPQLFYFLVFTAVSSGPFLLQYSRSVLGHIRGNLRVYVLVGLLMIPTVHFFSYEHPYLLADNRHFTFYIWRRWFLRGPIFKFVIIPIYLGSLAFIVVALRHVPRFTIFGGVVGVCLCLIPAHLVEFRYFIIPYTLVRLNFQPNNRLLVCFEILVHVLVNFFTIHLFLSRPFVWANEPQSLQRFMW